MFHKEGVCNMRHLIDYLVGAGRFERPTPCAQGIETTRPHERKTGYRFNELRRNRLEA
jgi:hypothetical protein